MTIVADLKGFTLAHKVFVMDNDVLKEATQASMRNMPELICELSQKYNCNKVILSGSHKYNKEINDKIKKLYTAKYNLECPLEIEY